MAFCGKCGASIMDGVSFCGKCGTPITQGTGGGSFAPPPQASYYSPNAGSTTAPGLVTRVMNILTKPKQEWPAIEGESTSIAGLYSGYIVILAALPVIASFIQMSILGSMLFRVPMVTGVLATVVHYALSLAGVYLSALIIDKLAPSFQSQSDMMQALKLVAYASTASWVAGIANIIPILGILVVLAGGLYGVYLFYLGLPVLMKTPPDKVIIYMIVSAVVIFVIYIVIGIVVAAITSAALVTRGIVG
jgi:hypothetical protein